MIKILTQNGIENTNLDGARDGYFNSGGKDGISSGILNNGTLTAQGNVLTLDTCEMRIKGHRIVIDEPITKTISGFPTVDTNYQFIAKITYADGNVTFDTEARPTTNLIQDDILNGNGTYEVVIGEFIHKTDGTIANLVQIMRVIFGGGGGQDGTTFTPYVDENGVISWTNDGGKENPPSVNIKGATGNSGVAEGTVNSNTEGTSDTDGYTQQAVNKIASRPNLLINPDFSINQRGQTTYTGNGYTVDRWRGGQSQSIVSVGDNGITLSFSEAITEGGIALQQRIEINPIKIIGKNVSISAKISSVIGNYWYCRIRYVNSSGIYIGELTANISGSGVVSASGVVPTDISIMAVQFGVKTGNVTTTDSLTVEWVKLEIGSVATGFISPLIAEELPKCQRYYYRYSQTNAVFNGFTFSATEARIAVPFPVVMRISPTMVLTTGADASRLYYNNSIFIPSALSIQSFNGNGVNLSVTHANGIVNHACGFRFLQRVSFDSEIY